MSLTDTDSVACHNPVVLGHNWAAAARSLAEGHSLGAVEARSLAAGEDSRRVAGHPGTAGPERKT